MCVFNNNRTSFSSEWLAAEPGIEEQRTSFYSEWCAVEPGGRRGGLIRFRSSRCIASRLGEGWAVCWPQSGDDGARCTDVFVFWNNAAFAVVVVVLSRRTHPPFSTAIEGDLSQHDVLEQVCTFVLDVLEEVCKTQLGSLFRNMYELVAKASESKLLDTVNVRTRSGEKRRTLELLAGLCPLYAGGPPC